jgi:hypothetical protein
VPPTKKPIKSSIKNHSPFSSTYTSGLFMR